MQTTVTTHSDDSRDIGALIGQSKCCAAYLCQGTRETFLDIGVSKSRFERVFQGAMTASLGPLRRYFPDPAPTDWSSKKSSHDRRRAAINYPQGSFIFNVYIDFFVRTVSIQPWRTTTSKQQVFTPSVHLQYCLSPDLAHTRRTPA